MKKGCVTKRRALHVSGNANNGSNAGLVYSNSNNAASNTNANIGSQLSFLLEVVTDPGSCRKITNVNSCVLVAVAKTRIEQSRMKKIGNIYDQICSMKNLELADKKARKNKKSRYGINKFDRKRDENLAELQKSLLNKTYRTSEYSVFKAIVDSGKEREIYRLPYYPDRITHHAIMIVLEPIWVNILTSDTYSCIKGRGVHYAAKKLRTVLRDSEETAYCLKLDIRKFYPSVDHDIMKSIVRRKIKDKDLLWLLDEIIDSAPGLPIGNYLSQYLGNIYLAYLDHWIKENLQVKHYFRYCDDMVILHHNKTHLHDLRKKIAAYIENKLNLEVKKNYQVFPVTEGIDFLGYKFYHTHVLLRKSIKVRFAKAVAKNGGDLKTVYSGYWGWAKHCDSKNLIKKLSA